LKILAGNPSTTSLKSSPNWPQYKKRRKCLFLKNFNAQLYVVVDIHALYFLRYIKNLRW